MLDPVGVSWGLQHGAARDRPGLPVLILGGAHGDIPIEPTAGTVVADLVTDEAVSTVIDISRHPSGKMWSHGEKTRFVADYASRLFERQGEQRVPLMQIIDEAGRFVPQQIQQIQHGSIDIARCAGAIEQLVELGRNVGVGVTLVTQRSAPPCVRKRCRANPVHGCEWASSGRLRSQRAGRGLRLRKSDLDAFLSRAEPRGEGVIDLSERAREILSGAKRSKE